MSKERFNLGELLNDDSFIHWLKNDSQLNESEKKKWDDWLSSNEENKDLLRKAQKMVNMPFKDADEDCDKDLLRMIKKKIKKEKENPDNI